MEKNSTKMQILEASLDLFSVNGYEATSVADIAEAVGIRKASLYSHFANKEEILDTVIRKVLEGHAEHSIFAKADWNDPAYTKDKQNITAEDITDAIVAHMQYVIHDEHVRKGRQMLTIEQFRNQKMKDLQTKVNYADVTEFFKGMMQFLIQNHVLKDEDPELMAVQFASPITVWINLCDRSPEREDEIIQKIHAHIRQFFRVYAA